MPTFLLWNVQGRSLDGYVVRLLEDNRVDVLLLVETPSSDEIIHEVLRGRVYSRLPSRERFALYTSLDESRFERLHPPAIGERERSDYWRFQLAPSIDVILVAVHGLDRVNNADDRRALFFERVAENIRLLEEDLGHKRTLILGDFNANPFEASVGSIRGLHAVGVREVAGRFHRSVMGEEYEFFYNPMWACYANGRQAPRATYYHNSSSVHEIFWHMLDQVVLRPDLMPFFAEDRLRVLNRAGPHDLVTASGLPDRTNASDHLPVLFHLNQRPGRSHARRKPLA